MSERAMKTFLCSYRYEGASWTFEIKAEDWDDAYGRLLAIKGNGHIDGELGMKIHYAVPVAGWFARAWCWLGNWLRTPSDRKGR